MNLRQLREAQALTDAEKAARPESKANAPLTQEELAARTNGEVSQMAISHLETGRRRDPKSSTLSALAEAMHLSIDDVHQACQQSIKETAA